MLLALIVLLASAPAPEVKVTRLEGGGFRLSATAREPEQIDSALAAKAQALCQPRLAQPGRYTFGGEMPGSAPTETTLSVEQEYACVDQLAEPPQAVSGAGLPRDEAAVRRLADRYLSSFATGDYAAAYALAEPGLHGGATLEQWSLARAKERAQEGRAGAHRIVAVTWYVDPPGVDPGLYAAVDYTREAEKLAFECGYLVWRARPDGSFGLVRQQRGFIARDQVGRLPPEKVAAARAAFRCPS